MKARPSLRPTCGTKAGYEAHKKHGEYPCPACQTAAARYQRARRFRSGSQTDPYRCRVCGSVFAGHACGGAR